MQFEICWHQRFGYLKLRNIAWRKKYAYVFVLFKSIFFLSHLKFSPKYDFVLSYPDITKRFEMSLELLDESLEAEKKSCEVICYIWTM